MFQSTASDDQLAAIASEAAISSSLVHRNIVSTYTHDVRNLTSESGLDLGVFKFHLIQEFCSGGSLRCAFLLALCAHSHVHSYTQLAVCVSW